MNERQGLFIVNEGPDGSGKETQTTLLCERLARDHFLVHRIDFPTYGRDPVADLIRSMLRTMKEEWNTRPWESKAVLYASNRLRFRDELLAALHKPRTVVVANRYTPSNQAHMAGYADDARTWEERFRWVGTLEHEMMGLPRPDVILLHTMPADTTNALLERRERGMKDAHEADAAYLQRVVQCFLALAQHNPERWIHIPADIGGIVQTPAEVHERVWEALTVHALWQAFARQHARVPQAIGDAA